MKILKRAIILSMLLGSSIVSVTAHADNRIRILSPTWSGFAPVFVAQDLGYFKALGIDVNLKFDDERSNVMAAMDRGDIEMDMRTIGEYQGRPRSDSTPGVVIGVIDQSVGGDGVIVDGSIKSVADLKGKTIASEPNEPGRLLLQLELKKAGLTLSDLKLKEIATADSVAVFADRSIAGLVTFQPFLSQTLKDDSARAPKLLISSRMRPGLIVDSIIVRQDELKKNPDKYRKFLIGMYKAIHYYETNPADFIKLAAPHFKLSTNEFKSTIDDSLEYTSYKQAVGYFGTASAPGPVFQTFDTLMGLNLENGAADHHLSAAKSIDPSIIRSISASDVQ